MGMVAYWSSIMCAVTDYLQLPKLPQPLQSPGEAPRDKIFACRVTDGWIQVSRLLDGSRAKIETRTSKTKSETSHN
jgi:hypothetical protein